VPTLPHRPTPHLLLRRQRRRRGTNGQLRTAARALLVALHRQRARPKPGSVATRFTPRLRPGPRHAESEEDGERVDAGAYCGAEETEGAAEGEWRNGTRGKAETKAYNRAVGEVFCEDKEEGYGYAGFVGVEKELGKYA
jgi:hypothetical protein